MGLLYKDSFKGFGFRALYKACFKGLGFRALHKACFKGFFKTSVKSSN